jgi:hypothetical protein
MKGKAEIHEIVDRWWNKKMVGNLIIYRAPNSDGAECIVERVVKGREMKPETRAAFEMFMDDLGIERGEIVRDKDGRPDRVKLTKRFSCD